MNELAFRNQGADHDMKAWPTSQCRSNVAGEAVGYCCWLYLRKGVARKVGLGFGRGRGFCYCSQE